jgi:thiopeptide-type bacteriocin biosynthesis protein
MHSVAPPRRAAPHRQPPTLARRFLPGSEWLYVKVYASESIDRLVTDLIAPIVRDAIASGAAHRWFFLRYADPEWHLRWRFEGDPRRLREEVMPAITRAVDALAAEGRVWRLELGTYERELERYGGDEGMRACEEIFHADSEAALAARAYYADPDLRWQLTLRGMDGLLDDLGLSLDDRAAVIDRARDEAMAEFAADADLTHGLGARYRALRRRVEAILAPDWTTQGFAEPAKIFERRSAKIRRLHSEAIWPSDRDLRMGIAGSLVHMHINRMLIDPSRAQELMLYDFLSRHYLSLRIDAVRLSIETLPVAAKAPLTLRHQRNSGRNIGACRTAAHKARRSSA